MIYAYCEEIAYICTEIGCKAFSLAKNRCTPEMGCICLKISSCSTEIGYKYTEISIASFYTCILLPYLSII